MCAPMEWHRGTVARDRAGNGAMEDALGLASVKMPHVPIL